MAVALSTITDLSALPTTGTGTESVTIAANTKAVFLIIVRSGNTSIGDLTEVRWTTSGGAAFTLLGSETFTFPSGESACMQVWYSLNSDIPGTGAQEIWVNNTTTTIQAHTVTYTAAADVAISTDGLSADGSKISSASITNPSETIALGGVSSAVFQAFITGAGAVGDITQPSGWSIGLEDDIGAQCLAVYTYDTVGTDNVTYGWTQTSEDARAVAIAIYEAGASPQTLTPSLYSDADTFYAATVSAGAVTLAPALYSDGDTFHAATVSQGGSPQTLTPDLFADGDTFHTATVSAGSVTLAPDLYSDADTFHVATVAPGSVTLTPALVSDGDTFYTYAVVLEGGPQTLSPEMVADGDTFHVATVTPGAVNLAPSLYTDPDTFHAAEVASGFNLQPPALADPDTFYPATVSPGAVTLAPQLFADGDTFYTAIVANTGVQTLEPSLLTDADTFYVPTVTGGARTIGAARSAGRQLQTGARSNIQTNRR